MLCPLKQLLASKRIVLASSSPRRKELIQNIGLNVELCPSIFEENLDPANFNDFSSFVEETALGKAEEVYGRLAKESTNPPDLVIAADTMVTLGKKIFGKPKTREEAFEMLSELIAGKSHVVFTGVTLKHPGGVKKFTETAKVIFGQVSLEQVQAYVDTGEPMDKAGGYGIQGIGGTMVERIEGDFFTVMGLPLYRLSREICNIFGYQIK